VLPTGVFYSYIIQQVLPVRSFDTLRRNRRFESYFLSAIGLCKAGMLGYKGIKLNLSRRVPSECVPDHRDICTVAMCLGVMWLDM
jgi:hypothetical protein